MPSAPVAWPSSLAGTPAIDVIERAIATKRLSHSLLLSAGDSDTLIAVALAIADRLLNAPVDPERATPTRFAPDQHPDSFFLRPTGKMR